MNLIQVRITRFRRDEKTTVGLLAINPDGRGSDGARQVGFTLEDTWRDYANGEQKIKGISAIPDGEYDLGIMNDYVSPMTDRYRKRFDWFDWHLHVKDVANYTGIYHHIGNRATDTDGCLLVGFGANLDADRIESTITRSTECYKEYYLWIRNKQKAGHPIKVLYQTIYVR